MSGVKIAFKFIPFPQEIVDGGLDLSLGEYRLLGYLLRHRFRLAKATIRLTQDEIVNGRLRPDGGRFDKGSGITSGRDLKAARERLEKRQWIHTEDTPQGTLYAVLIAPDEADECEGVKVQNALSKSANCTPLKVQNVHPNKEVEGQKKEPNIQAGFPGFESADAIQRIWDHFIEVTERHPKLNTLTDSRRRMLTKRFDDCLGKTDGDPRRAEALMKLCIDALGESDFHMAQGQYKGKTKYNSLEQLFRSTDKMEEWMERAR